MALLRTSGLTRVSLFLAALTKQRHANVRQRLREWYWEKEAKAGKVRQELDVTACFRPLLKWVLSGWPAEERRLALAMDASSLGMRFVVLSLSVVYRGCAIPVAWKVLRGAQPGSWKPEWLALLAGVGQSIPPDWQVLVLADRGLYAGWLFRAIQNQGWHPFLRINQDGLFRPEGSSQFLPLRQFVQEDGKSRAGRGLCFKTHSLQATLLTAWGVDHSDPWLIVTDLAPEQAQVAWYGMRSWIENGFRSIKRGGWQWQNTRMTDPARATRFWLALAVASLWAVSVGGEADANLSASSLPDLLATQAPQPVLKATRKSRSVSCLQRGTILILAALLNQDPLPFGRFVPEPWPS